MATTVTEPVIGCDRALSVAHADAVRVYRNLSAYVIQLALETDGWHIDYELKDSKLSGGGPHYVVDAATGAIITKRYDQ